MGTELTAIQDFKNTLEKQAPQFAMALPPQISAERFQRTVLTAVQKNPKLLQCDRPSLWAACMQAASQGLMPDGIEAAIIPFKDQAQFMPMVAGLLKKIRNSGEIISICAELVYEGEPFRYWVDSTGKHLEHSPNVFGGSGSMLGAYALAVSKDGGTYIEVMNMAEIDKVRSVSRSKDSGPWKDWTDRMILKTVIRRLSKLLPMSSDVLDLIRGEDDETYQLDKPEPLPPSTTPKSLIAAITDNPSPI